jgi:hypothetical protein
MNNGQPRNLVKEILGLIPSTARAYQALRPDVVPAGSYAIDTLIEKLPSWITALESVDPWVPSDQRKRVLIIGSLKWWLEYGIVLGLLLKSGGHDVDLAYLPFRDWTNPITHFDALRGAHYIEQQLRACGIPLGLKNLQVGLAQDLDREFLDAIIAQAELDVQYTVQREEIRLGENGHDNQIYRLRLERNEVAVAGAYSLLEDGSYDTVIIPNGSILEFGAIYRVAQLLGVKTVTYEFGEQRERLWLAHNSEVMRQDTSALWQAVKDVPLTKAAAA